MPRIQPSGHRYAASFGGFSKLTLGTPTIDPHVVLQPASGDWWLNDREIVTFTTELVAYDIHTQAQRPVLPGVGDLTWFSAGGNRIAVWSQSRGPLLDGEPIQVVPVGFGPDGTFAWRDWGSNTGITLTPPGERPGSSRDVRITDAPYVEPQIFDFDHVFWQEGHALRGRGIDTSRWQTRPGGFGWTRAEQIAGRWYLVYQSYRMASVVLHAADDASRGFAWSAPLAYRIALTDVDGKAFVVWSVVDRDWPEDIRTKLVDPAEARPFAEPEPEPEPQPEPEPDMPDSLLSTVEAVRAKYDNPSQADLGKMLNEIAWIHRADGWGLNLKPSGNSTTQPKTGKKIAVDILHHKPTDTIWDCFRDAGGATEPSWGEAHPHNDPSRVWVAPVQPEGVVDPEPDPEPEPEPEPEPQPGDDVQRLILAELRRLNSHLGVR